MKEAVQRYEKLRKNCKKILQNKKKDKNTT